MTPAMEGAKNGASTSVDTARSWDTMQGLVLIETARKSTGKLKSEVALGE